ncbi:MAG TPA: D-2-hydroxyacid dehydrogenase [Devosia sp.]|jgi:phosphoglycerate dehydrogenase-like enzyme|uniref:D-2-hydroxyacid dehydrogenase n=1 Tax=Devosia sp. TaxID=1871048 RepID=UPI002DDCB8DE|nr:D-2-hydroxyacid dehydrogenase [Devosia sp.]HEV2515663.1 D-2-hydroxyacid dehydrogenase [Devosia sp.]
MPPKVLLMTNLPFSGAALDRLLVAAGDDVVRVEPDDDAGIRAALETVEVAVLAGDLDARHLGAPRLKWVHCDHAGLTRSARPEVFERGLIVTGSAGRSGPALAEHVMLFALLLTGGFLQFHEAQRRGEWLRTPELSALRALAGRTMGIVGMGHTGTALARRAKAFEMQVLGYRRRDAEPPEGVDEMFATERGDTIDAMLPRCEILALVVNLSDATSGLIGARQLALLPRGAIVINLSRGEVIDQDALVAALKSEQLGGAGLDVTTPEPLPPGHPLWSTPNVLITPHFTPALPDKSDRSLEIILDNFARYRAGTAMRNRLTPDDVYRS